MAPTRLVASRRVAARGGRYGSGGLDRAGATVQPSRRGQRRPLLQPRSCGRLWAGCAPPESRRSVSWTGASDRRRSEEPAITDPSRRPRRPASYADLTALIDAAGGQSQTVPSELAATTAAAVLEAGRAAGAGSTETSVEAALEPFVELADTVGLDTLRALWRGAEPISLASSLWTLYLLRGWSRSGASEIVALWSRGEPVASADAVVAGLSLLADEAAVAAMADTILVRAFAGDFAVALERAAAVFRVLAAGRRRLPVPELEAAERHEQAAVALTAAARRWRSGTLR